MAPKKDAKGKDTKGKDKPKKTKAGDGGKSKKKKWSKGKVREKLANLVLWDKATVEKLYSDVPKWRVITPNVVSDRLKVSGSLAREGLRVLEAEGKIRAVYVQHDAQIYTRGGAADE